MTPRVAIPEPAAAAADLTISHAALIFNEPVGTIEQKLKRNQIPTMILSRRPRWRPFDLLLAQVTDHLCDDGGLDRTAVARALSLRLDELRAAAKRLRPIKPGVKERPSELYVFIVKGLGSSNIQALAGTMGEMDERLRLIGMARVCFVSLATAWDTVWHGAQEVGVDLGPLSAATFEG